MEAISQTAPINTTGAVGSANSFAGLDSEDFFKLLVTQLTNQDPFEPTGNEELLQQISSIRDIELSTTLTQSLARLSGQQQFGSASALIGQHVSGAPRADGEAIRGLVVGVRFDAGGQPVLLLANGSEMPLDQVSTIEPPIRAAEALVGQTIIGVDQRDPRNSQVVEGLVMAATVDEHGEILLELDSGDDLRFRDLVTVLGQAA